MEKYMRVRKIGEGAFGKADLVKRKKDNSQMVIKEINILRMGSKEREEARKEVSVLAQLNHPNIVAYRESFEEHGNLYIVMDYCAGGDLYAKINTQKGVLFSEDQILDWFVQMCLAIKHIHDRKILHRDIKSQNIFLTSKGMIQLGDFGIAKVLNSTVELARTCIGTPYYLSPEICENKPYNNKSDIWSLGCVLYELATLKHAFEAGNMKNLVLKIIRGSYPPVSPKYSYELRNLIAQLFKRAPSYIALANAPTHAFLDFFCTSTPHNILCKPLAAFPNNQWENNGQQDRPSINSVLKKPILSQRIPKFLTQEQLSSEFSHTVMHGHKLGRALPPPPKEAARPPSAARNRADVGGAAAAAAAVKRHDPSKIYGAPVVGRSKENRASADRKRPGSAGSRPGSAAGSRPGSAAGSRPGSAAGNRPANSQDMKKRRLELVEKEKKRREEMQKKEYERRHKDLQDRQKLARINKAREDGWNNLIGSLESDSGGKQEKRESPREPVRVQQPAVPPRPVAGGDYNSNAQKERGKYEHYNQYLDKLQQERELRKRQEGVPAQAPAAAYMAAPRPLPGAPNPVPVWRQAPKVPAQTPLYQAHNQRAQYQKEERARLVDDFINRKKEAQLNKQRGQAQLFGPAPNNQYRPPSGANNRVPERQQDRPSSAASSRNREEQEYLEKLRQIRQQNYQERKMILGKNNPELEAEERKKKAEALKKQAEDWAKQRKDVIDKKKKELMDKERHIQEVRQNMNKPVVPVVKPAPSVPMTGAIDAIGVAPKIVPSANKPPSKAPAMTGALGAIGVVPKLVEQVEDSKPRAPAMTGALEAIGAVPKLVEPAESRSEIQKKKDNILRKLNEKGPPKESDEPQESARSKWGGGAKFSLAEQTQEAEPESARRQWGPASEFNLGQMTLEETGSQMEATSARDQVIINPESAKRQWGRPGETVINALQEMALVETMSSNNSEESVPSPANTNDVPKAVGSTITISRLPIKSGTIVIATKEVCRVKESSDDNKNKDVSTNQNQENVSPTTEKEESQINENEGNQSSNQNEELQESSNQIEADTNTDQSQPLSGEQEMKSQAVLKQKPPVPSKPVISEKPILLPKPVLLKKPDAPMNFATGIPAAGKDLGAGSLFEKVELEEEEEPATEQKTKELEKKAAKEKDNEDDYTSDELGEKKKKSGLVLGITIGSFDIGHRELLRTCSEPDLSSLFKTMVTDTSKIRVRSLDDMSTVKEEDGNDDDEDDDENDVDNNDDVEAVYSSMEKAVMADREDREENGEDNNEDSNGEEEQEELDEDDEDIADLMSVRATMQSLLLDDSDEESNKKSPVKFNLSSDRESKGDTNDGDIEDTEDDVDLNNLDEAEQQENNGDDDHNKEGNDADDEPDNDVAGDDDDLEGDDEFDGDDDDINDVEKSPTEDDKDEEDSGMPRSHSVDNENPQTPDEGEDIVSELFQTDESDSEFNDGEEMGDFDLFGRLEESRAELEQELGADKLVKVYKTVQALQEDEDENMEEGARIAQELLGKEKEHLYPKIFQLVMADAAFTDDGAFDFDDLDLEASFR